ncbi:MAG: M23 family metallopeptidase [Actinomycetota bacterium]|nr:M23 family metallopeptidase [Actinomycetota bacterium]
MRRTSTPSRLGPIRDTGIIVGGHHRSSRRSSRWPVYVMVAALVIVVILLAASIARRPQALTSSTETTTTASVSATPGVPPRDPTPTFASYRSLMLRLPIDGNDVTAIAFHQASGEQAIHLSSLVGDADMALAAKNKAVPRSSLASASASASAEASSVVQTVWDGKVLRLWRSNRRGAPDTAIDVGADPGTDVFAPVTGTVVQIRSYNLYEKYPDYEIHIRPDGWAEVDVVLIHVDDVSVKVGERVAGGVSRIACVREMSGKVALQLGGYTRNGGDHVHVQLNQIAVPGKLERLTGS